MATADTEAAEAAVDGNSVAEGDTAEVDTVVAADGNSVVEVVGSAVEDGNSAEVVDTAAAVEVRCVY